jgi:hypothetical protein
MKRHQRIVPAARPGLVAEETGRECVVFDTTTNEAHLLAPLVAAVFAQCDGRTRIDDLPALASSSLGEPVCAEDVAAALRQLQDAALLDGPSITKPLTISRRTFAKGAAATAGAAVLITTVATPAGAQTTTSPAGGRCPDSRCVSQSEGDVFCGCNNACPPGSPGAGSDSTCTSQGLTPPFFDSCECRQCPTPTSQGEQGAIDSGQCLPPDQQTTPCGGGGTPNLGCADSTKPIDGVCVPEFGDTSESCLTDPSP